MLTNEDVLMISDLLDVKFDTQSKVIEEQQKQFREEICSEMQKAMLELRREFHNEIQSLRTELQGEIQSLRTELQGEIQNLRIELQEQINGLKGDVSGLKTDVSDLKTDVSGLKTDASGLKADVNGLKTDVSGLKADVRDIKLLLENDIQPRLSNIESCYVDTYKRYSLGVIEMESIRSDVDLLKKVAKEHSNKLKNIQ